MEKKENRSLFAINANYMKLIKEIELADGEVTDEQLAELECTQEDFENKMKSYYYYIKGTEGTIKMAKEESDRLKNLAKSKQASIDRMEEVMKHAIHNFVEPDKKGKFKYDGGLFTVSLRNNVVYRFEEDYVNEFIKSFIEYIKTTCKVSERYQTSVDEIDLSSLLGYITTRVQDFYRTKEGVDVPSSEYLAASITLLSAIEITFKKSYTLSDFFEMDNEELSYVVAVVENNITDNNLEVTTPKAVIKNIHNQVNGYTRTESNESVNIK